MSSKPDKSIFYSVSLVPIEGRKSSFGISTNHVNGGKRQLYFPIQPQTRMHHVYDY